MKRAPLIVASCILAAGAAASAQNTGWQPSPGHTQTPLWPSVAPGPQHVTGKEFTEGPGPSLIAGKPVVGIRNVSQPTMTVYYPTGRNTGAAVVVFPGGGYMELAIDLEGSEVCDWLTPLGITCVLLKYRVPAPRSAPYWGAYPQSSMALQDAQRTIGLVRLHAAEWHIDPHKIGVLGFSAGGHLVAAISTHFTQRLYPAVDAADKESCRPDFAIAIYPGHMGFGDKQMQQPKLNPDLLQHLNRETPPTFLVQAEDDHTDSVNDSLTYYIALKNAGVPAEMHLYAHGGHAFGLRRTKQPITQWPDLAITWLHSLEVLPAYPAK